MASDPRTENWLTERGAQWKLARVPLAKIDIEKSLHNQARVSQPLQDETVLLYGTAMEAGDIFPPIVTYINHDRLHVVIDGNHRVAGADAANISSIEAYVVTNPTPAMVEVLIYEANVTQGLPTSLAERVQQALHLEALGMSRVDAARILRVPARRLDVAVEQQEADTRIYRIKRGAPEKLSASVRRRLHALRSDRVLTATIELILDSRMNTSDVNDLVVAINRERDEADQLLVVAREAGRQAQRSAATAGGRVKLPGSLDQLNNVLADIGRIDPDRVRADFVVVGDGMKMVIQSAVADAKKRLSEILQ